MIEIPTIYDAPPDLQAVRPCAIAVTRNLIKEQNFLKQKGLRCGNPPIEKPLVGSSTLTY
jgi:hypothetical protein